MFTIKADDLTLWSPIDEKLKLVSPTLNLEVNKTGSLSFTIYPDHPYYDRLVKMKTIISVYQENRTLFKGRVFSDNTGFHKVKKVEVEGVLGYFNDSIVRPYSFNGSISEYVTMLIEQHNNQVEPHQRFKLGSITVTDTNDYITRASSNAPTTWSEITEKLIKLLGGYICIRYEEDGNYIDYLADYTDFSTQDIAFAVNLLDLNLENKADTLSTCIIPYGAKDSATGEKIDIKSVNGGVDYIYNAEAVAKYGRIFEVVTWEDVTLPENLLSKARLYLADKIKLLSKLTIKAIDLHLTDETIEAFKLGDYVKVYSSPHGIDETVLLTAYSMDLTNPSGSTITLGLEKSSFLGEQISNNNNSANRVDIVIKDVADLETIVKKNVNSVSVFYYLSTSATELVGGSWVTDPPEWVEGRYYWQKTVINYVDGSSAESTPICITGAKGSDGKDGSNGKDGTDGVGVESITTQFYLSTSQTALVGGSWVDVMPEWSVGDFLWIRSIITYSDGSVGYTEPICDSSWTAIDNLEVGGRNYLRKTDTKRYFSEWQPWSSTLALTTDGYIQITPTSGATSVGAYPPKLTTIKAGKTYTVSFEAYADVNIRMGYFYIMSDGGNTRLSNEVDITTTPDRYSFTFTATSDIENCSILFGYVVSTAGSRVFYLKNPKLELGNKATDWTPAPEDTSLELETYKNETYTYINESIENSEETTRTMLKDYVSTSQLESVHSEISTTITQTAEDVEIRFNRSIDTLTEKDSEIVRVLEENSKYIRLEDGNIILGEVGALLTTKIANGRISFLYNDTVEVAYISDQKLYITHAEVLNSIVIGKFAFIPRSNGNLSFKKI